MPGGGGGVQDDSAYMAEAGAPPSHKSYGIHITSVERPGSQHRRKNLSKPIPSPKHMPSAE
eukprot:scaffold423866_cov19-Prasinocladus_malaysianus.AAC.1